MRAFSKNNNNNNNKTVIGIPTKRIGYIKIKIEARWKSRNDFSPKIFLIQDVSEKKCFPS